MCLIVALKFTLGNNTGEDREHRLHDAERSFPSFRRLIYVLEKFWRFQ